MGVLSAVLLVQVLYVHETGVVLYVWVAGCAVASVAGVAGAVGVRRQAIARPVPPARPVPSPAAADIAPLVAATLAHHAYAAASGPGDGGRHAPAPGRWPAALVGRIGEETLAHDVTAEDLAAAAAAARAGVR